MLSDEGVDFFYWIIWNKDENKDFRNDYVDEDEEENEERWEKY